MNAKFCRLTTCKVKDRTQTVNTTEKSKDLKVYFDVHSDKATTYTITCFGRDETKSVILSYTSPRTAKMSNTDSSRTELISIFILLTN